MLNYSTTLDAAEHQAFMNSERRTIYLSYRAVGMMDYINVARAALSGKKDIDIPVDDLDYALATFSNAEAVLVANAFRNTEDQLVAMATILEENGSQLSHTYNDAYNILTYCELADLKPYATADRFLSAAGMKPADWGRLLNGYDLQPKQLVDEAKQLLKRLEENPPTTVADEYLDALSDDDTALN